MKRFNFHARTIAIAASLFVLLYLVLIGRPASKDSHIAHPEGKILYINPRDIVEDVRDAVAKDNNDVTKQAAVVKQMPKDAELGDAEIGFVGQQPDEEPPDLRVDFAQKANDDSSDEEKTELSPEMLAVQEKMPIRLLENATKVLLLTYYRGGSTFLGEIFNKNDDAFYWFEPLGGLLDKAYNKSAERPSKYRMVEDAVSLAADNVSTVPFPEDFAEVLVRSAVKILNCDFQDLPKDILKHYFLTSWGTSASFAAYKKCVVDLAGGKKNGSIPDDVIDKCVPEASRICLSSGIRSLKTIRMTVREMTRVLQLDPSIVILYYARDPRGLLNSRWSLFGRRNEDTVIKLLCSKMRDDAACAAEMLELEPRHFYRFRYEDFATNPIDFATQIYSTIKHDLPEKVMDYIRENTQSDSENGVMGTKRKNSTDHAIQWQRKIPRELLDKFNADCKDIIEAFEYPTDA